MSKRNQNKKSLQLSTQEISQILKVLRIQYNLFLILMMGFIAVHAWGGFIKYEAPDHALTTQLQSVAVLVTLGGIPAALRYFGIRMKKIREIRSVSHRIAAYKKNALIRLGVLEVLALLNLTGYFVSQNYSFLLIAGMVLVASVFCIPTVKRITYDLSEEEEEAENDEA
ncbi:MAG: hypothetical protein RR202_09615 [Bacteroidales bacterium]